MTITVDISAFQEDLRGWNSTDPIFKKLIDSIHPKEIIEVGSWLGASAVHMLSLAPKAHMWCIDTWLGALEFLEMEGPERDLRPVLGYPTVYYQFLANIRLRGVENRITVIPNTSQIAAKYLNNKKITADLIYVDGSHDFQDVLDDVETYMKLLKPGGVLFGDDYGQWESVRNAVHTYNRWHQSVELEIDGNHWLFRRT